MTFSIPFKLLLMSSLLTNTVTMPNDGEIHILPFAALARSEKTLHVVDDYFNLIQHINVKPIIEHIHSISIGFTTVKDKFYNLNDTKLADTSELETKFKTLISHLGSTIEAGLQLLPSSINCRVRNKRSVNLEPDQNPVNTDALLPSVGRLFGWVTGTLSSSAGTVINNNFNNIRRLTKMSSRFAKMFNATLNIELKHKNQITKLSQQVKEIDSKFNMSLGATNRQLAYNTFLDNIIYIVIDLQHTMDTIFRHTDMIEINKMGPLTRDPVFLNTIQQLMNNGIKSKPNSLYLMKLAAKTDIEVCHWSITINYIFPILRLTDYVPYKVIPFPKKIKNKYFTLDNPPNVITWGTSVLIFTKEEYDECQHFNKHVFCRAPSHTQGLLQNCIYSILNKLPWKLVADKCPLEYVQNPQDFLEFTKTHLIYFTQTLQYATVLCPGNIPNSEPLTLLGAGAINIPTGCKVKYQNNYSFAMGHISRSLDTLLKVDNSAWDTNLTHILPLFKITNVENNSTFWDESKEEEIIKEGVEDVKSLLDHVTFTPNGVTYTLWSLIGIAFITTVICLILLYLICVPGCIMKCHLCCCCIKTSQTVDVNQI